MIEPIPPTSALDRLRAALAGTLRWGARDGDVPVDRYLHRSRDDERALVEAVCDELKARQGAVKAAYRRWRGMSSAALNGRSWRCGSATLRWRGAGGRCGAGSCRIAIR